MASADDRRTAILTYVRATWNEIAVDAECAREAGLTVKDFHGIPRPLRTARFARRWPRLTALTGAALRTGWFYCFLPLLLLWRALVLGRHIAFARTIDSSKLNDTRWIIATTSRAPIVVSRVPASQRPRQWLAVPWIPIRVPDGDVVVRFEQMLRLFDLPQLVCQSWRGARVFARGTRGRPWCLQTFTAFEWFSVWLVLSRLEINELWTANHYDRWAVLADRCRPDVHGIVVEHGTLATRRSTVVQHGVEHGRRLKTRLTSVERLFIFNEESGDVFRQSVLSRIHGRDVEVVSLRPTLELTSWRLRPGKRVLALIVGHPLYLDAQVQIMRHLAARVPAVQLLFKGHPLFGGHESPEFSALGAEVVHGRITFPAVDFVISYNSTLAHEYAAMGCRIFFHDKSSDESILRAVENMAREVLAKRGA